MNSRYHGARPRAKKLGREIRHAAAERSGHVEPSWSLLGERDQVLERIDREFGRYRNPHRDFANEADGRELADVERQALLNLGHHHECRRQRHEQCLSVRGGICDSLGRNGAAGTRLSDEQDPLTPSFVQSVRNQPHRPNCCTARPLLRYDLHRSGGKDVGLGAAGERG